MNSHKKTTLNAGGKLMDTERQATTRMTAARKIAIAAGSRRHCRWSRPPLDGYNAAAAPGVTCRCQPGDPSGRQQRPRVFPQLDLPGRTRLHLRNEHRADGVSNVQDRPGPAVHSCARADW